MATPSTSTDANGKRHHQTTYAGDQLMTTVIDDALVFCLGVAASSARVSLHYDQAGPFLTTTDGTAKTSPPTVRR